MDQFVGELGELSAGRVRSRHVVVTGLPGCGKSSLVEACAVAARGRGFAVLWPETQEVPGVGEGEVVGEEGVLLGSLALEAVRCSTVEMQQRVSDQVGDINIVAALLAQIAQARARTGGGVLIQVDHMERIADSDLAELTQLLLRLRQDDYAHVPVVVLGTGCPRVRGRLAAITDAAGEAVYESVAVRGRLTGEQTWRVLEEPARAAGLGWEVEAGDLVWRESLGHPAYVQILADKAWQIAQGRRAAMVAGQDVIQAVVQARDRFVTRYVGPQWRELTSQQHVFLSVLAVHGGASTVQLIAESLGMPVTELVEARDQLAAAGLITPASAETGMVRVVDQHLGRRALTRYPRLRDLLSLPPLGQIHAHAPTPRPEMTIPPPVEAPVPLASSLEDFRDPRTPWNTY